MWYCMGSGHDGAAGPSYLPSFFKHKMVRMGSDQIFNQSVASTNDWILEQNQHTTTPVSETYCITFALVSPSFLRCPTASPHFLILMSSSYHIMSYNNIFLGFLSLLEQDKVDYCFLNRLSYVLTKKKV